ncbi:MAG: leucine-rich repeat domain-containing protein, partial [Anaeroplasmataceae bacterium]|nr:leucine-rich repeat domain-containing protein [Anaeroplasmataceae bacterium]
GISAYSQNAGHVTQKADFYYYIDGKQTNVMWITPSTATPVKGADGFWYIDGTNTNVAWRKFKDPSDASIYVTRDITYRETNGSKYAQSSTLTWSRYIETKEDSSLVYHFKLTVDGIEKDDIVVSLADYNSQNYPTIETKTYWVVYGEITNYLKNAGDVWSVGENGYVALNGVETTISAQYADLNNAPTLRTSDYYWYINNTKVLKGYTEKASPALSLLGWNWVIDGTDTGLDAFTQTGITPTLKTIVSGDTIVTSDLYWTIGGQVTTVLGYDDSNLLYNIMQDADGNYYWYIGDTRTIMVEVPHVDANDKYWYVGSTNTNIWSVKRSNDVVSIGKNNCWYIGTQNTKISCIKYFAPSVSQEFISDTTITRTPLPSKFVRIGVSSFENCKTIRRVNLDGIEIIDYRAFYGCDLLDDLIIPTSLQETGDEAFRGCVSLVDLVIESNNLGEYMFADCTSIMDVAFADGLERTPTGIFQGATSLQNVDLPSSLKIVGEASFENCTSLPTIEFPDATTTLEDYAFRSSGIERVVIKKNITNIGVEVFAHCKNLEDIIFENATLGDSMLLDCTGLVNLALPEGITEIATLAFADCIKLETVILPTTLQTIGYAAFRGDYKLAVMSLPFIGESAGTTVGEEALFGWIFGVPSTESEEPEEIAKVENQKTNMQLVIQYALIDGVHKEVEYYIPTTLKKLVIYGEYEIGYGAFSNCSDIVAVLIKDNGITSIGDYAFAGCTNLTYLIDKDDEYPVHNADGSVTHSINRSTDYADYINDNTDGYAINIPVDVTSIGNYAFYACHNVESVYIYNEKTISYDADNKMTMSWTSVLKTIGNYAFADCDKLVRINEDETYKYNF